MRKAPDQWIRGLFIYCRRVWCCGGAGLDAGVSVWGGGGARGDCLAARLKN